MASRTPEIALRQLLDDHVSQLLNRADQAVQEQLQAVRLAAGEAARRETAERLNQAVRLLEQAEAPDGFWGALAAGCSGFAAGVAVFQIEGEELAPAAVRGVGSEAQAAFASLRIPLASAAALNAAVASCEPVVAAATPAEVSQELAAMLGHSAEQHVNVFPIAFNGKPKALAYAWGEVERAAVELLCHSAGAAMGRFAGQHSAELVTIAAAPSSAWDSLTAEDQRTHLRAQRFARVQVAGMRLQKGPAVQAGRARRAIYHELQQVIDTAREEFRAKFFSACPSMLDYLHLELVRTLANEDPELLGRTYPGPLV